MLLLEFELELELDEFDVELVEDMTATMPRGFPRYESPRRLSKIGCLVNREREFY